MLIGIAGLAAAVVYVAMARTDDTNLQIGVVPVALLLLFTLVPAELRLATGLGLLVGVIGYAVSFVRARGAKVPLGDLRPSGAVGSAPGAEAIEYDAAEAPSTRTAPAVDGPYYVSGTPEKHTLSVDDTPGEPMLFHGRVFDREGKPLVGAAIELWHADGNGDYDNEGHVCRGHQFTGPNGEFAFRTVKPFGYGLASLSMAGRVDYRSAHIHVKILRPDGTTFTTQVWFDDDPRKAKDVAYASFAGTNSVELGRAGDLVTARYDFAL